ncbi:hypothetical protein, partial [Pseudomonas sp. SWI36]|uniref:hypothetical protein n=1 Tax=Pseudomonas sp. SWI36 TaxID=2083052 RepID=UPI001C4999D3
GYRPAGPPLSRVNPFHDGLRLGVGAGLPANTVATATVSGQGHWPAGPALSRVNPFHDGLRIGVGAAFRPPHESSGI